MRIDIHCHVGLPELPFHAGRHFSFEPPDEYAPCAAYFSPRLRRSVGMILGRRIMGVPRGPDESAVLAEKLLAQITGARLIDRAVVLAFDQYHTQEGRPLGPRAGRASFGTDLYVSNTYVRSLADRYPDRILFGASIHPYRPGATDMLDEVAAAGAVLVKWLPPAQNIDAADPRTVAFLRHAGRIGMPLLIHGGGEMTLGNLHPRQGDPLPLLATLRRLRKEDAMPTVIVAHMATPSTWFKPAVGFRAMVDALLGEFADAPLYADVSALGLFSRGRWLKRLLDMPAIQFKLVYGSDFPIPPTTVYWRRRLGGEYARIRDIPFIIDRDVAIKSSLGLPESVFTRAAGFLPLPSDLATKRKCEADPGPSRNNA